MKRPTMATVEKWSRIATAVFSWLGMLSLGGYIFWTIYDTPMGRFLYQPSFDFVYASIAREEGVNANALHVTLWYYSPLNIQYWGVALLAFSPALGCSLLVRYLAWRRNDGAVRSTSSETV